MSFSLGLFNERKMQLQTQMTQLLFVLEDLGYEDDIHQTETIKRGMDKEQFQVIVVGEFSKGKSMFINALLGRRILPSLARPTTAIRNVIVYDEKPTIRLHFKDESKQSEIISEEQFTKLVAPKDPYLDDPKSIAIHKAEMERINAINYAEVGYPLDMCKEGVTIVDTPGLNDLDPARAQITNEIIPRADVAIFLLSAIQALTASEKSLLVDRLIGNSIQKIFIVINFKDDLGSDADAQKVYMKVLNELREDLPNEKIYLVSAKEELKRKRMSNGEVLIGAAAQGAPWNAEETGFPLLERDISAFLQFERGAVKLGKPLKQVQKLIERVRRDKVRFELETLHQSQEQLQGKVAAFQQQLVTIREMGMEAKRALEATLIQMGPRIKEWYSHQLTDIASAGLRAFDDSQKSLSELPQIVDAAMAPLERELHVQKQKRVDDTLKLSVDNASRKLNEEWIKLEQQYELAFIGPSEEKPFSGVESLMPVHKSEGIVFFDDLIDELSYGWHDKSTTGKILSGAGLALTVTFYSIVEIGRTIMGIFTGSSNKKDNLRRQINSQLNQTNKGKVDAFISEWAELTASYTAHYGRMIERQIALKEQQLEKLLHTVHIEESELQEKQFVLRRLDEKLIDIQRELLIQKQIMKTDGGVRI